MDGFTQRNSLWRSSTPRARGGWFTRGGYKGKYQTCVNLHFQTLNIVWDDFWPQNRIPGKILILLDTQDLSVHQKLPKLDIAMFVICHGQLPFLAMSNLGSFWRTDKSWVSKSIRILPGIRFWGLKPSQTTFTAWKQNLLVFVDSCLVTLEGNLQPFTAKFGGPPLTPAASIFLIWHVWKEF